MDDWHEMKRDALVESIRAVAVSIGGEAERLQNIYPYDFDPTLANMWCATAVKDALVRVALLIEQNFEAINTLSLVAVSRYLFELSIWLKLFEKDSRYGLLYYGQLIDTQRRYYESTLSQMKREHKILRDCEVKERRELDAQLPAQSTPEDRARVRREIAEAIDKVAARNFSIYAEEASLDGYGPQANHIQFRAIPEVMNSLNGLAGDQNTFDQSVLPHIKDLWLDAKGKRRRWRWNEMAELVGMETEYEYIYAFSSKLLHATPSSISTNQMDLLPDEYIVFMRYVEAKLMDLVEVSKKY